MKHGPLMLLHFGSVPYCVITSGKLAREVTNTHYNMFYGRIVTKSSQMLFSKSDGMISSPESNSWRSTRKLCVLEFLNPKRVQSLQHIREEEVARLLTSIRRYSYGRSGVILRNLFFELATNVVSKSIFGLKSTNNDNEECQRVQKLATQGVHIVTELFSFEDFIPSLAWLDHLTGFNKKLKADCDEIHAFLDEVIDERIRSKNESNDKRCFLDIMLEIQEKQGMTRSNIRSILADMFIAEIPSTGSTMEWAMTELARNPNVMKKVQDEVRSIVAQNPKIHEHDIDRMEFLKCVVKETLRLHGPTMTARQATNTVTLGGFKIPAEMNVMISIWAVHRDPSVWDRPLEFLPERFLNTSYGFIGQDQYYFPFGLGKRICPGTHFAMSEIEFALANVLCWFDWELPSGIQPKDIDMREGHSVEAHKLTPLLLVPVPFIS